jgi:adenine-specific DNA methylase
MSFENQKFIVFNYILNQHYISNINLKTNYLMKPVSLNNIDENTEVIKLLVYLEASTVV